MVRHRNILGQIGFTRQVQCDLLPKKKKRTTIRSHTPKKQRESEEEERRREEKRGVALSLTAVIPYSYYHH